MAQHLSVAPSLVFIGASLATACGNGDTDGMTTSGPASMNAPSGAPDPATAQEPTSSDPAPGPAEPSWAFFSQF